MPAPGVRPPSHKRDLTVVATLLAIVLVVAVLGGLMSGSGPSGSEASPWALLAFALAILAFSTTLYVLVRFGGWWAQATWLGFAVAFFFLLTAYLSHVEWPSASLAAGAGVVGALVLLVGVYLFGVLVLALLAAGRVAVNASVRQVVPPDSTSAPVIRGQGGSAVRRPLRAPSETGQPPSGHPESISESSERIEAKTEELDEFPGWASVLGWPSVGWYILISVAVVLALLALLLALVMVSDPKSPIPLEVMAEDARWLVVGAAQRMPES
jgi:hypothetical protein